MTNPAPLFSIVVPTFNRATELQRCLEGVRRQRFTEWELIVVDDGSTDNTREVVSSFLSDRRIQYFFQENRGVSAARNAGLKRAAGDYVLFLDSDDLPLENWLLEFRNAIPFDICFCGFLETRDGVLSREVKSFRAGPLFGGRPASFLCGVFCVRRMLALRIGGYDEQLRFSENTEFGLRLMNEHAGAQLAYIEKALVRLERTGIAETEYRYRKSRAAAVERILSKHSTLFDRFPAQRQTYHAIRARSLRMDSLYDQAFKAYRNLAVESYKPKYYLLCAYCWVRANFRL